MTLIVLWQNAKRTHLIKNMTFLTHRSADPINKPKHENVMFLFNSLIIFFHYSVEIYGPENKRF